MQNSNFNALEGMNEFTLDDRRKVKDVFDRILDEMGDNFTLDGMFTPYANIVHKILTDTDITQQVTDEEEESDANWATNLGREIEEAALHDEEPRVKYLAVAVVDEKVNKVKRELAEMRWTRGVKEVVIDDIDGDTFETVTVLT